VAEVETAVPAFIGYTARTTYKGKSYKNKPTKIKSLADYKEIFGGAPNIKIDSITVDDQHAVEDVTFDNQYYMYDGLELFYANGGGKCYIVAVGTYGEEIEKDSLKTGLDAVKLEDEPTLLLFPDAPILGAKDTTGANEFYALQQDALSQAASLMDRFVIMDLLPDDDGKMDVDTFRDSVGINDLKYGAAYTPYLKTVLPKKVAMADLLDDSGDSVITKPAAVDLLDLTDSDQAKASIQSAKNVIEFQRELKKLLNLELEPAKFTQFTDLDKAYKALAKNFYAAKTQVSFTPVLDLVYGLLKLADQTAAATNSFVTDLKNSTDPVLVKAGNALERGSVANYAQTTRSASTTAADGLKAAIGTLNSLVASAPSVSLNAVGGFFNSAIKITATSPDASTNIGPASGGHDFGAPWDVLFAKIPILVDAPLAAVFGTASGIGDKLIVAEPVVATQFALIKNFINDLDKTGKALAASLEDTVDMQVPSYKAMKEFIEKEEAVIPPSSVVAGVYSKVDSTRGVWKAPANVSLNSVFDVSERIDNAGQEDLNVDVVAGKSVNAIRPFAGKGVMVWGARTLAGNDNEWRYVSVRRFFNMVEESVKKSTYWAVFEPNDANLWVKVKAMIENYLTDIWRDGALAGAKPEDAFFVNVGLGKTMTSQDILEGRLVIEIGMAVVRPAEFIVLRFMHKMQES
jgi:phage tail sheath protein FI